MTRLCHYCRLKSTGQQTSKNCWSSHLKTYPAPEASPSVNASHNETLRMYYHLCGGTATFLTCRRASQITCLNSMVKFQMMNSTTQLGSSKMQENFSTKNLQKLRDSNLCMRRLLQWNLDQILPKRFTWKSRIQWKTWRINCLHSGARQMKHLGLVQKARGLIAVSQL